MKHGFFVTGTDTGVGKTLVSTALVHAFAQQGWRSAGMKPVAAGCEVRDAGLLSDDVAQLCAASNVALPLDVVNPYAFQPPLAPHIAAEMAGVTIDMQVILQAFKKAAESTDVLIVEGVGGLRVPLNAREDTADLAHLLGLPVILVVGMRLGCLSHALLTAEAIAARGLPLCGWIASGIDPHMAAVEENLHALHERIAAPCLAVLPFHAQADFNWAAAHLSADVIGNLVCA